MAAQILIWKIELDKQIKGIYPEQPVLPVANQDNAFFAHESNKETSKNESFADDSNNFLLLDFDSLRRIKETLMNFKVLSGLECNVEKSYLMRFGNLTGEIDQNIIDLGFPVVNSITVLGFILQNSANMADANFVKNQAEDPEHHKILGKIQFEYTR